MLADLASDVFLSSILAPFYLFFSPIGEARQQIGALIFHFAQPSAGFSTALNQQRQAEQSKYPA
jgi:hypothetical protein